MDWLPILPLIRVVVHSMGIRGLVASLWNMIVARKYLCESVSQLDLAIESDSMFDCPVKSHQESGVTVVVFSDGRAVERLHARLKALGI